MSISVVALSNIINSHKPAVARAQIATYTGSLWIVMSVGLVGLISSFALTP